MGFITPSNTDQIVVSLFCIVLQRILRLSLESQEIKTLHKLSFSTLGRNVKTALTFPSICHFWFLWEDEANFTETTSNQHRRRQDTLWLFTLCKYDGQVLWWPSKLLLTSRCSHLCVISSLCMWLASHQQITAKVMRPNSCNYINKYIKTGLSLCWLQKSRLVWNCEPPMASSTYQGTVKLKSLSRFGLSVTPNGLYSPWSSPGQDTGVGSLSFCRGSSQPRYQTQISHSAGRFFTSWATREAQGTVGNL